MLISPKDSAMCPKSTDHEQQQSQDSNPGSPPLACARTPHQQASGNKLAASKNRSHRSSRLYAINLNIQALQDISSPFVCRISFCYFVIHSSMFSLSEKNPQASLECYCSNHKIKHTYSLAHESLFWKLQIPLPSNLFDTQTLMTHGHHQNMKRHF